MSNRYLSEARSISSQINELTDAQKKAIDDLQKKVDVAKSELETAIKLIDKDVKCGKITERQAKLEKTKVEVDVEEVIENLHNEIKKINPSFSANAKEIVEDTASRLAYNAVELSGKAAGTIAQLLRPFVQVAKESFKEAKATAGERYAKPAPRKDIIDELRGECK
jgi:hypothetical protein